VCVCVCVCEAILVDIMNSWRIFKTFVEV